MVPWNGPRAKVQLRLANQRLRLLQEKKLALAKQTRRDIADLLIKNRVETARLRVETLIAEDIQVELLELVELYSETLLARFALVESSTTEPDPAIADALTAIVYSAPQIELKELHLLREMLMHKFGRTWSLATIANDPPLVPPRIVSKLALYLPPRALVDAYLEEIARGYGVEWRAPVVVEGAPEAEGGVRLEGERLEADLGEAMGDGEGAATSKPPAYEKPATTSASDDKTPPQPAATPSVVAPPPPAAQPAPPPAPAAAPVMSEFEMLAARFEALKKR